LYRHSSQTCCLWNVRFAEELPEDSPFKPREALAGRDARTLAREVLAMDVEDYRAALKGSPMKRGNPMCPGPVRTPATTRKDCLADRDAPQYRDAGGPCVRGAHARPGQPPRRGR
jgi:hypothetical protein